MSRYINLDEVIEKLNNDLKTGDEMVSISWARSWLNIQPAADVVEVRRGHWIDKSRNINGLHDPRFDCSVCGHIFWFQGAETFNYCPACGAKMDVERSKNGKS